MIARAVSSKHSLSVLLSAVERTGLALCQKLFAYGACATYSSRGSVFFFRSELLIVCLLFEGGIYLKEYSTFDTNLLAILQAWDGIVTAWCVSQHRPLCIFSHSHLQGISTSTWIRVHVIPDCLRCKKAWSRHNAIKISLTNISLFHYIT